jgi:hypothetical protein
MMWNESGKNNNDYDLHCVEPRGKHIHFADKINPRTGGNLDIDIRVPNRERPGKPAVENITWPAVERMEEGMYEFYVHNFNHSGGTDGFRAEIEFNGEVFSFACNRDIRQGEKVPLARVEYTRSNGFRVVSAMDGANSAIKSKDVWGVKTNQFSKVEMMMYSPNYWDGQDGIGNKHVMFMLHGCKTESSPRGFFNEFLSNDLTPHRKVFEVLGSKMRVDSSDQQLSGVGFSSTQRNSVIVRVKGHTDRVIRVTF